MTLFFVCYFVIINLISGGLMYLDKQKAIQKSWRVQESNLHFFCAAGGFLGTYAVMHLARHKTKQWQFSVSVLLSALFWSAVLLMYYLI